MTQPPTQLSVHFPGRNGILWLVGCFFFLKLAAEEIYSSEPNWGLIILPILFIALACYYLGRFLLSPSVSFNDKGVYISPAASATRTFVPFENITQLKLISPAIDIDMFRKHKKFELLYKDESGNTQKALFMLHYNRGLIDKPIPIHAFLKHAKEVNKDFVFDQGAFYGPHH